MTRPIGRPKSVEMIRVGWRDAVKMVEKEGYRLQRIHGKGAELLNPPRLAQGSRGFVQMGGEAYFYIDRRSLAIYDTLQETRLSAAKQRRHDSRVRRIADLVHPGKAI